MALEIEKTKTLFGIPATYWRPIRLMGDFVEGSALIVFGGYADAAQRGKGAPIEHYTVSVSREAYLEAIKRERPHLPPTLEAMMGNTIYELAAADPFFAGAKDV